ncbi:MAG: FAD/NAD(P)-binding protein [Sphingobium sp.]
MQQAARQVGDGSNSPTAGLPVAVVGAGFSGTLLAINLRRLGVDVVLVEREASNFAKGLAFGTIWPDHLLNVRASNMSAFPDDPGHFLRWLGFSGEDQAARFVPRLRYGHYLSELLFNEVSGTQGRMTLREGDVRALRCDSDRAVLRLSDGDEIAARAVVLALGNLPPAPHPLLAHLPGDGYFADPWDEGAMRDIAHIDHILLLGTGLTAVDVVLSLESAGWRGRVTALSRRGLRPRAHAAHGPVVDPVPPPHLRGSWLVRCVRRRAAEIGWRGAVDELRPHVQDLWRRHDPAAQGRFLRHLRPYWDVHRHRIAPEVAARLERLEQEGRLRFLAGRIVKADPVGRCVRLEWRPRGADMARVMRTGRIVSCTGPEGDITRVAHPLLRGLVDAGQARPDVHRLGLDVDHLGRVRDLAGRPQSRVFAAGPVTKGEAWEIIAVPDIRHQLWNMARYLSRAHWVGGEGL